MLRDFGCTSCVACSFQCASALACSVSSAAVQRPSTSGQVHNHFCDAVLAFYVDGETQERTHLSVIAADDVYTAENKCFHWSETNRAYVFKNRINLRHADAAQQIKKALEAL